MDNVKRNTIDVVCFSFFKFLIIFQFEVNFAMINKKVMYEQRIDITASSTILVDDLISMAKENFLVEDKWDEFLSYQLFKVQTDNSEGSWLDPNVHLYIYPFENITVRFFFFII